MSDDTEHRRLVATFRTWFAAADGLRAGADPDTAVHLVEAHDDHLERPAYEWRRGDVRRLLLDILPARLPADEDEIAEIGPSLAAWLRFLDEHRRLEPAGALGELHAELAAAEEELPAAMADRTRWGPAKTMVTAMLTEGVDVEDPAAMQAWVDAHNAKPLAERRAALPLPGDDLEPDILPLRMAPPADPATLVAAAEAAPLVTRIRRLVAHVAARPVPVTGTGNPKLAELPALVEVLGTGETTDRDRWGQKVRSASDLPGVAEAWTLATWADLLDVGATKARLGEEASDDPVTVAYALADAALEAGCWFGGGTQVLVPLADAVDETLPVLLALLYQRGEPVPADELDEVLLEVVGEDRGPLSDMLCRLATGMARDALERLARLGMVDRYGVVPAATPYDDEHVDSVAVTPLGEQWLAVTLPEIAPVTVPTLVSLAEADAATLLSGAMGGPMAETDAAVAAWCAARTPQAAAAELLGAARTGDLDTRAAAFAALSHVGPAAEPAVRGALDDPVLRPFARLWLVDAGVEPAEALEPGEGAAAFVESCALMLIGGGAAELCQALAAPEATLPLGRLATFVGDLWRVESPYTEPVLESLGHGFADKAVRRAAKQALYKLRQAR